MCCGKIDCDMKESLIPGKIVRNNIASSRRNPIAEDIKTILNQMDKMLELYDRIIEAGTHTDIICKDMLSLNEIKGANEL